MSIGIFDSGFGGLTVFRAIRALLPNEKIIYFGDTARLPYGNKSPETIIRYSLENAQFLMGLGIKILVVACHTACSQAFSQLEKAFSIPVVGVIPTFSGHLKELEGKKHVAVLGTRGTISSGVYQALFHHHLPHVTLSAVACPLFAPLVEEGYIDHPIAQMAVAEYLHPLKANPIDAVLLACTHYPLLAPLIQKELGEKTLLIDTGVSCAHAVKEALTKQGLLAPKNSGPAELFYVSDDPDKFRLLGKTFLSRPIESVLKQTI